ncbi:hypothetical protein FRC10_006266 [Ceratobasidium sp. 414]|nr:hypothetical protein FRC10_006266 [Ceratobasidium sp. 414]
MSNISTASPIDPHLETFGHWESAQDQLIRAIQVYSDACATLDHLPDSFFQTISGKIPGLTSGMDKLCEARTALFKIRNRSQTLAPISMLPSEILTATFSMAYDDCLRTCFSPVRSTFNPKVPAFASVCTQWRELYLQSIFSSHLDLIIGGSTSNTYYSHAAMLAGRSTSGPLHLVIKDHRSWTSDVNDDEVSELVQFLIPLMPRVRGIDVTLKEYTQHLLDRLVSCWVKYGSTTPLRALKIWNSSKRDPVHLRTPATMAPGELISPVQFNNFFEPVQILALQDCYAPSASTLFKALVGLRLDWPHKHQTSFNVLDILSASPGLRSLTIEDAKFLKQEGSPEPVWLSSLKNLCLSQSKVEGGLKNLLPSLYTRSDSVNVIVRVIPDPDFVHEFQALFRRSNVKRMFVYGSEYTYSSVTQLCPAPDLRELVLRDCNIRTGLPDDPSTMAEAGYIPTPWPQLHTVYLIRCTVDGSNLRKLIESHPIRKLWVYNKYGPPGGWSRFKELLSATERDIDVKFIRDETGCPTRSNFLDRLYA